MKAIRREQYEAAAQLQRQQTIHSQQQHQQQQPSQQSHVHQQQHPLQNQHQHQQTLQHQHHNQRSPGLIAGSYGTASRLATHEQVLHPRIVQQHQLRQLSSPGNLSQRGQQQLVLGPVSPPATPGDCSPTSPANKHSRSQQLVLREAAGSVSPGLPPATLDLSSAANTNSPHELSTLV
jgi:hypothetical protein